ncbi:hypothetical protein, partial [Pseudomonas syringae]|uniref:hypothetical protein n=1 Tax=Pseudomonas syringae TaxID=317 RepID=UPI001F08497B
AYRCSLDIAYCLKNKVSNKSILCVLVDYTPGGQEQRRGRQHRGDLALAMVGNQRANVSN